MLIGKKITKCCHPLILDFKLKSNFTIAGTGIPIQINRRAFPQSTKLHIEAQGSLLMRFTVQQAGVISARDARASFQPQRAGRGAAELTGARKF